MKVKFEQMRFGFDSEPHYIKKVKLRWWSRWEIVMDGCHPLLFRRCGNELIPF